MFERPYVVNIVSILLLMWKVCKTTEQIKFKIQDRNAPGKRDPGTRGRREEAAGSFGIKL